MGSLIGKFCFLSRQAAGEVVVLGRRVNLDMDSSATLYKVAREWFYDNPELFAKDVRLASRGRRTGQTHVLTCFS